MVQIMGSLRLQKEVLIKGERAKGRIKKYKNLELIWDKIKTIFELYKLAHKAAMLPLTTVFLCDLHRKVILFIITTRARTIFGYYFLKSFLPYEI